MSDALLLQLWTIAYILFLGLHTAGILVGDFGRGPQWLLTFKRESYPFAPFVVVANLAIVTWGDPPGSNVINYAATMLFIAGWLLDHDDDDRWKRRRKRLGGRVRAAGHRLVVEASS